MVIGTDVGNVCEEIKKLGKFEENAKADGEEKTGIVAAFFGTLTAIFQPIIPALAGSGMIKALLALLVELKLVDAGSMNGGCAADLYAGITGIHTFSSTTAGIFALPVYIGGEGFGNVINAERAQRSCRKKEKCALPRTARWHPFLIPDMRWAW